MYVVAVEIAEILVKDRLNVLANLRREDVNDLLMRLACMVLVIFVCRYWFANHAGQLHGFCSVTAGYRLSQNGYGSFWPK